MTQTAAGAASLKPGCEEVFEFSGAVGSDGAEREPPPADDADGGGARDAKALRELGVGANVDPVKQERVVVPPALQDLCEVRIDPACLAVFGVVEEEQARRDSSMVPTAFMRQPRSAAAPRAVRRLSLSLADALARVAHRRQP